MTNKFLIVFLAFLFAGTSIFAQDVKDTEKLKEKDALKGYDEGWTVGTGFGLTLDQAAVWQPRAGAGDNSLKFGGLGNLQATYKAGRFVWDNAGSMQLNFQRLGRNTGNQPFQKSLDELRLNSRPGYAITTDEKWYAALDFGFLSQLLKTYEGNYLKNYQIDNPAVIDTSGMPIITTRDAGLLSQMFSPATITISPGVDWKPNTNFSLFFSPAAARLVTVLNDEIAALPAINAEDGTYLGSLHGNPQTFENGAVTAFDNVAFGLGALAKAKYNNTFLEDRVSFTSELNLYYDYLNSAKADKNVPTVDWLTSTTFNIFKGIGVTLRTGAYYDYTKPVSTGWGESADGAFRYAETKRGIMFTETLALTYSRVLGAKKAK